MSFSVPPGYRRTAPIRRPKLDGFREIIERWLVEDVGRPRKQRRTAKRVFDRLRDEHGFTGGYTIVKDYVREQQRRGREMFVPLHHAADRAQADFGEAMAVIGGIEQKAYFFAFDLPHSDASFIRANRPATAGAWVDGHIHAFAFFGRVPLSVLYDNDKCLVARILPDGTRSRTRLFSGFLSHYVIQDRYGRPGKGNDTDKIEQPFVGVLLFSPCPLVTARHRAGHEERWPGKFGQCDRWISCLTAAMLPRIRSEHDETHTADTQPRLQGEGGSGGDQGREDACRTGQAV